MITSNKLICLGQVSLEVSYSFHKNVHKLTNCVGDIYSEVLQFNFNKEDNKSFSLE